MFWSKMNSFFLPSCLKSREELAFAITWWDFRSMSGQSKLMESGILQESRSQFNLLFHEYKRRVSVIPSMNKPECSPSMSKERELQAGVFLIFLFLFCSHISFLTRDLPHRHQAREELNLFLSFIRPSSRNKTKWILVSMGRKNTSWCINEVSWESRQRQFIFSPPLVL